MLPCLARREWPIRRSIMLALLAILWTCDPAAAATGTFEARPSSSHTAPCPPATCDFLNENRASFVRLRPPLHLQLPQPYACRCRHHAGSPPGPSRLRRSLVRRPAGMEPLRPPKPLPLVGRGVQQRHPGHPHVSVGSCACHPGCLVQQLRQPMCCCACTAAAAAALLAGLAPHGHVRRSPGCPPAVP